MIFLLMPVAYYASFRLTGSTMGFLEFWVGNFRQGIWFDGPGWFIWYLLFLDLLAIPIFYLAPGLIDAINRLSAAALRRPILFASGLAAAATMAYVPLLFHFGAVRWLNWGPLQVQLSRTVLYVVFFVAGIGVGAAGIDRGLLARSGMLARHWASWTLAAALSFGALSFLINFRRMRLSNLPGAPPLWWQSSYGVIYATSCTLICLAVLALFLRFAQEEKNILDPLRDDAYGIYVIHYVFCLWLQYGLLSVMFPATVKMTIVFAGTLAMAWVVTAALRRIPGARRVL
jgi:surface polysaccharide O-acyltransferase-like enzyme